jgi:uncharacterized protein YndB with AHSA1/START domain
MPDNAPTITVETSVAAPADTVYGLITDLDAMAQFGEEVTAMKWAKGNAATVGSVFRGSNRNGWHRWTTTCTVSEADAGRAFAWNVSSLGQPIARWRYEVTPTADGCTVVESMWDRRSSLLKSTAHLLTGIRDRVGANEEHMRVTLERLKARAEQSS